MESKRPKAKLIYWINMADENDDIFLINERLTAADGIEPILIYTPRFQMLQGVILKRYGLINTLRINAKITSLDPVNIPPPDPAADTSELAIYQLSLRAQPHKTIRMLVEGFNIYRQAIIITEVALIPVYPNSPRYLAEVVDYFTTLEMYGFQFGYKLWFQLIDMNNNSGVLSGNDEINIYGSVVEKSTYLFDTNTNAPIDLIL